VRAVVDALRGRDFARMGGLLTESHRSLRDDFEVSTANIDALVARADAIDGCYGARIMGAGFGGSILALVDQAKTEEFASSMHRPVLICTTADGAFTSR